MMTLNEKAKLFEKVRKLEAEGKLEEAWELEKEIPLAPHIAKAMKEVYGVDAIKNSSLNFHDAEATYGKDWLNR